MLFKNYLNPHFVLVFLLLNIPPVNFILADQSDKYKEIVIIGEDHLEISADLYESGNKAAPIILLFHQAHSSRGEYRQIAPQLVMMGFNCLAVDTRAGDTDRWNNVENKTTERVEKLNLKNTYLAAYSDLESALNWVKDNGYTGKIIVWGSSFSSTLVFKLADENKDEIAGLLSFSPGEYYNEDNKLVESWAANVNIIPCFVTCGAGESKNAKPIFDKIKSTNKKFVLPEKGRHGSSILLEDNNNWKEVRLFLGQFIQKK